MILLGDVLTHFLFQPYPSTMSWPSLKVKPLAFFWTQLSFDAGNLTRLLSFHGFSSSKNRFSPCKPPTPRKFLVAKIVFFGGKVPWSCSRPLLFPFFVQFNDLPLLTPPKLPNAQKVIGGRLQPHPARLRWPTKHTAGVHRSCWTPSLHYLKLGVFSGIYEIYLFFWDEN